MRTDRDEELPSLMISNVTLLTNWIFSAEESTAEPTTATRTGLSVSMILLISGVAALLSIAFQGFHFNVGNNLFQTPIAEHWSSDPAFAHDALIGSLKYYVSGLWALLMWLPFGVHTEALFFGLHFLARGAALAVMCAVAANLGVKHRAAQILLVLWLALAGALRGSTSLGNGDLFIDFFSHTELTMPLMLLSLLLVSLRRFFWGFALLGLIFDINAFTAVWTACAAVIAASDIILGQRHSRRPLLTSAGLGIAAAALLALPVAYWVYIALTSQPPYRPFDYVEFLKAYYPNHFLIEAAAPADLLIFFATIISMGMAFKLLGKEGRPWFDVFCGFILVFAFGVCLPFVSHNATLLNLHLLRVDGIVRVIAVLILAIVATRRLIGSNGSDRLAAGLALCFLSLPGPAAAVFAAVLLYAGATLGRRRRTNQLLLALTAIAMIGGVLQHKMQAVVEAAVVVGFMATQSSLERLRSPARSALVALVGLVIIPYAIFRGVIRPLNSDSPRPVIEAVKEVARWARANTDPQSVFLVPLMMEPDFELWAKRTIWVDWKQGAAVMWAPSFYWTWWPRMQAVAALRDLQTRLDYACRNGIQYVVTEKSADKVPDFATIAKQNSEFLILKLPASCPR
jgi:hypothetical protein